MITLPIEFLALGAEGLWDDVSYQLVGFFIVLITLIGLWIALEIIGSIFRSMEKRRATEAAAVPIEELVVAAPDSEMYAVVAAAIDTFIGQPHQIVSISSDSGEGSKSTRTAWSSEGRKDIYRSHRFR
jgi:Na+-transporting methylmalonyl-CoA/oxaloacetate decarboxylase gamma subunit